MMSATALNTAAAPQTSTAKAATGPQFVDDLISFDDAARPAQPNRSGASSPAQPDRQPRTPQMARYADVYGSQHRAYNPFTTFPILRDSRAAELRAEPEPTNDTHDGTPAAVLQSMTTILRQSTRLVSPDIHQQYQGVAQAALDTYNPSPILAEGSVELKVALDLTRPDYKEPLIGKSGWAAKSKPDKENKDSTHWSLHSIMTIAENTDRAHHIDRFVTEYKQSPALGLPPLGFSVVFPAPTKAAYNDAIKKLHSFSDVTCDAEQASKTMISGQQLAEALVEDFRNNLRIGMTDAPAPATDRDA